MKKLVFLVPLLFLFSCDKTVVYENNITDFSDSRWQKMDVKTFEFDLKKDLDAADVELTFTHTPDPQYASLPLNVLLQYPDGHSDKVFLNLQFGNNSEMSECDDNNCKLEIDIKEDIKMPKGKYMLTVENKYMEDYVPNVLGLGVTVEHSM